MGDINIDTSMEFRGFIENQDIARLQADLQTADQNAELALEDLKQKIRGDISQTVGPAMESLERDLRTAMQIHPGDESLENISISFGTLQRRIKRLLR